MKRGTYDKLMFNLENCCNYFNTKGELKQNVYQLYEEDIYLGIFKSVPEIAKYIGITNSEAEQILLGKYIGYDSEKWYICKIDTEKYREFKPPLNRMLVCYKKCSNGKCRKIGSYKNMIEASKSLGLNINSLRNHVSGNSLNSIKGYTLKWEEKNT